MPWFSIILFSLQLKINNPNAADGCNGHYYLFFVQFVCPSSTYVLRGSPLPRGRHTARIMASCGLVNNKYRHVKIAEGDIYFFRIVLGCRGGFIRGPHYGLYVITCDVVKIKNIIFPYVWGRATCVFLYLIALLV